MARVADQCCPQPALCLEAVDTSMAQHQAAQLLCSEPAALGALGAVDYVQNSCCMNVISLMHLKNLGSPPNQLEVGPRFLTRLLILPDKLITTEMRHLV